MCCLRGGLIREVFDTPRDCERVCHEESGIACIDETDDTLQALICSTESLLHTLPDQALSIDPARESVPLADEVAHLMRDQGFQFGHGQCHEQRHSQGQAMRRTAEYTQAR